MFKRGDKWGVTLFRVDVLNLQKRNDKNVDSHYMIISGIAGPQHRRRGQSRVEISVIYINSTRYINQ